MELYLPMPYSALYCNILKRRIETCFQGGKLPNYNKTHQSKVTVQWGTQ